MNKMTAVQKYTKPKPVKHALSVDALYAANRAIYELIQENPDLTCRTIAINEAGDEIKYAFEGAFRNMTPDDYASEFHTNSGGNYDALNDILEHAPRTLEALQERLDNAVATITPNSEAPNSEAIVKATAGKKDYITSGRVLTAEQYVQVVNSIKTRILAAARTARLPDTIDVEATELQPSAAAIRA